jgi:hypothetical protein
MRDQLASRDSGFNERSDMRREFESLALLLADRSLEQPVNRSLEVALVGVLISALWISDLASLGRSKVFNARVFRHSLNRSISRFWL